VIAPGLAAIAVHALLDDDPASICRFNDRSCVEPMRARSLVGEEWQLVGDNGGWFLEIGHGDAKKADALATSVHPIAVAIPVAAFAWFVLAAWIAFAGGEMSLVLAAVTFVSVMFFGLLVGGGALARNVTPERAHQRSFREFLDGDVDIATGPITGRVVLWQIAMAPIALAVGGTIMIGCAVWVRS
jgi:hypothetical protein